MQDPPSGTPRTRIEVRKDATIRGAWALNTQVFDSEEQGRHVQERVLDFWDLTLPVVRLAHFAGAAYALRRPVPKWRSHWDSRGPRDAASESGPKPPRSRPDSG